MKFIIISDSHGNKEGIDKIFKEMQFDGLIFLGDGVRDLSSYMNYNNVYCVSGNCDFFSSIPNERELKIMGKKVLITHGNKYNVKSTLNYLKELCIKENYDIILFGHTHKKEVIQYNNSYIVNPGSFRGKADGKSSGLIMYIGENSIKFDSFEI